MKYLVFLLVVSCAPVVGVAVKTADGQCELYAHSQITKDKFQADFFCGAQGNVSVQIERTDR